MGGRCRCTVHGARESWNSTTWGHGQVRRRARRRFGRSRSSCSRKSLGARKTCFVIQGDDRVGALADTLQKLADAKINVTAIQAVTAGMGRYGAIFWVKPRDAAKAAKTLGAS